MSRQIPPSPISAPTRSSGRQKRKSRPEHRKNRTSSRNDLRLDVDHRTPLQELERYEVERVERSELRRKGRGHQLFYLIKFKGYDDAQWEPWQNLRDGAEEAVAEFHDHWRSAGQPGPWDTLRPQLDEYRIHRVNQAMHDAETMAPEDFWKQSNLVNMTEEQVMGHMIEQGVRRAVDRRKWEAEHPIPAPRLLDYVIDEPSSSQTVQGPEPSPTPATGDLEVDVYDDSEMESSDHDEWEIDASRGETDDPEKRIPCKVQ
ncbi:hypothetical protein KCU71_g1584, partial [Aureobasidium melanogenum]